MSENMAKFQHHFRRMWPQRHDPDIRHAIRCNIRGQRATKGGIMSLSNYSVHIENGMRVRHDARARFTVKSGRLVLEDELTSVETLGGAMTQASIVYNALSYSGGVSWAAGPKVQMRVRPQDVLVGEQMCGCPMCQPVSTLETDQPRKETT